MTMRTDYPRHPRDARDKQTVSRPARERRIAELHLSGYPSVVNEEHLDVPFVPSVAAQKQPIGVSTGAEGRAVAVMTTNQLVARLTELAKEEQKKTAAAGKQPLSAPDCRVRKHNTTFDRNSTYRLDYCNKEVPGFHARERLIPDYKINWTDTDKMNIEESKKFPYLTIPESALKKRPTVYRNDYIPLANREEYRTLSHKTNLQDLGTSFAFSMYSVDDPKREVKYDPSTSSLHEPRCVLWKTYSPRDSFALKKSPESTTIELNRLREMRRNELARSLEKRMAKNEDALTIATRATNKIILPGMRGMGYRQAPKHGENTYIHLPSEHFCHQTIYDY